MEKVTAEVMGKDAFTGPAAADDSPLGAVESLPPTNSSEVRRSLVSTSTSFGESNTVMNSVSASEKQPTGDNAPDIVFSETRSFQERFRAVESKMNLVDTMYRLHESTVEAAKYSDMDPHVDMYWRREGEQYMEHLNFYRDAMFFMGRIRQSHERIVRFQQHRKAIAEAEMKARNTRAPESETIKQISIKAFLKGERAKVMQVNWDAFTSRKADIEKSVMTPIEVVSSEPEPQVILELAVTQRRRKKLEQPPLRQVERVLPTSHNQSFPSHQPLPERIKIHSEALIAVFSQVTKSPRWAVAKDGSLVFLRPYQELVYYKDQLRDWLADLEKNFKHYDWESIKRAPNECNSTDLLDKTSSRDTNERMSGEETNSSSNDKTIAEVENFEDDTSTNGNEMEEPNLLSSATSITALVHLRCLMHFVATEIEPKQEYINSMQCTRIHFHDLWYLFKPGDKVINQEEKQVYIVLRVQNPRHKVEEPWERWNKRVADDSDSDSDAERDESDNPFTISCAYIDFDGKTFGPVGIRFKISPFGELKQIKSLPVYPLRFSKDSRSRENIIERSRMLLDVAKFKAMYYMGVTLDKRDEIDSQVVIDFNEALADEDRRKAWEPRISPVSTAPDVRDDDTCMALCCVNQVVREGFLIDSKMTEDYVKTLVPDKSLQAPSLILSPRSLEDTLGSVDDLTEAEFLVMTYRVFGFVLRSRKWAQLDLTLLRYENSNARNLTVNAFEKLELPDGHREMVKSLVIQHFRTRQSAFTRDEQTDLIQGKGKGLILLLHGAPGVGKTTTAEGIAELFRRPLFQITCGDLGTTAKEVETELEKNFALASRWGCILLLDEADVFLSAREKMDFNRNGLVAVFLRILEYYAGILFLTTNRIGDFDEAFASRIHMSLHYPELDEQKTLKVFKLNLELIEQRFQKQRRTILFDPSSIEDFAQQHFREHEHNRWNGRQIRNACQTALALAEFDAQGGALEVDGEVDKNAVVKLQLKYFKTVQRAYLDFGKYLGDIQGTQGDRRAIDYKLRARSDTPYQMKPSLFSQRGDLRPSSGQYGPSQNLYAQTSSGLAQSNVGSQQEPYQQSRRDRPSTPNRDVGQEQDFEQYPSQLSKSQSYNGPIGNPGGYEDIPSFRQPRSTQYTQIESQYQQEIQQGQQYDSSPTGFQPVYSREARPRPGSSFNSSPVAYRSSQVHEPEYKYDDIGQEGGFQDPTRLTQEQKAPKFILQRDGRDL